MLRSRSLRLSLAGAALFVVSTLSLLVLPHGISVVGMLTGGICVWAGFIWTLFSYYRA